MFGYSKTTKADKSQAVPPLTRPEAAALIGTIGSTEKSRLRILNHRGADPSSLIAASSPACLVGFDGKPAALVKKEIRSWSGLPAGPSHETCATGHDMVKNVPSWAVTGFLGMSPEGQEGLSPEFLCQRYCGTQTSLTTGPFRSGRRCQ